ncbi:alpha/beta-hydrolase [Leucogyrophana mollusca]|uniref:Alpha/beta-hydrolase n=1 Tax=Leucogyrophana mollusca TaxID=85980 RepID=A0ACB8BBH9_9AGAM|nr:alpha/beta-hydrolase [Leucogyrophana mollusca]
MAFQLWALSFSVVFAVFVNAQTPPSSYPQVYPGMPQGDYSPEWQAYFQVTDALPNVTWPIARNWAGNIPVQREGHPNDTLFFWAFENSNGSMTAAASDSDEPWGIWLNGGPGSSSLVGLLFENGPIHIQNDYSLFENEYSWSTIADYVWIDQPVGVGFGTADSDGYIADEDQMASDFFGFLENLVKVFPGLATRPLHLTGESYAGMYIPYITKAYFEMENPPVKLAKIAIGDGSIASGETFELLPVVSVLETYPQIIGYDTDVLQYFREQTHLCGYDLNLTYPQDGHFPTLGFSQGGDPNSGGEAASSRYKSRQGRLTKQAFMAEAEARFAAKRALSKRERLRSRDSWKRGLEGRANGSIDAWYGCDLYDEMLDYAINYTFPWSLSQSTGGMFDVYNVPDALNPEAPMDASVFLNDPRTRAAIHAPTSTNWTESILYPFGNNYEEADPSIEPMAFLTDLATNATAQNMSIVIFSGNDDSLIPHLGSQVTIQNTTFGGIQGFTRKPSTPWYNDAGEFAGIVHQERGWTYVLVEHAGHLVGYTNPTSALVFMREFVYGNNQTGLVTNSSGTVTVVGGENSTLAEEIMPGQAGIYYGAGTTASTYYFPTATIAAWEEFVATATAAPVMGSAASLASSAVAPSSSRGSSVLWSAFIITFMMFW